jgi:hypothetical protein
MNAQEIDRKYPIRNQIWHFSDDTDCWYTEASMLDHAPALLDPWNRPITSVYALARKRWDKSHEDVVEYQYTTSVEGIQVELRIWND